MVSIAELPDIPRYSIKTVSVQTGIRPVTIRAWERRYRVLDPQRAQNRYRQYSDREIALLRWVKSRVDEGTPISRVAADLKGSMERGLWPEAIPVIPTPGKVERGRPPEALAADLYNALIHHDAKTADELLRTAHSTLVLRSILQDVLTPCLVQIGEAWSRGDIRVSTEHYASQILQGHIMQWFLSYPVRRTTPLILTGCAATELHQIGALMVAALLREDGYRVEFLGADLPVDDLVAYAEDVKPAAVLLSAASEWSAAELATIQERLARLKPAPIFGYGGRIFVENPEWRMKIRGMYLGNTFEEGILTIERLLQF